LVNSMSKLRFNFSTCTSSQGLAVSHICIVMKLNFTRMLLNRRQTILVTATKRKNKQIALTQAAIYHIIH
jgi:hypothetical protein